MAINDKESLYYSFKVKVRSVRAHENNWVKYGHLSFILDVEICCEIKPDQEQKDPFFGDAQNCGRIVKWVLAVKILQESSPRDITINDEWMDIKWPYKWSLNIIKQY